LDPLPVVLIALTVTTGLIDAVSYLGLGHVFTANMTGNIVFLGFALAGTPGLSVGRSLASLAAFLVGALLGGRFGVTLAGVSKGRWLLTVAIVEAVLNFAAAAIVLVFGATSAASVYLVITLSAVAMGLRNATVRRLALPDLTTTVLTLTATGLAADSSLAGGSNPRWGRRLGSILAMCSGGAIGAVLLSRGGLALPLAVTGTCVLIAGIVYAAHPAAQAAASPAR
jgi:uncharacterized membrane protein YoaK (UPF0700 family)